MVVSPKSLESGMVFTNLTFNCHYHNDLYCLWLGPQQRVVAAGHLFSINETRKGFYYTSAHKTLFIWIVLCLFFPLIFFNKCFFFLFYLLILDLFFYWVIILLWHKLRVCWIKLVNSRFFFLINLFFQFYHLILSWLRIRLHD
jgi:hypothetical protein